MARTRNLRKDLMSAFGYINWKELRANIKEASDPFEITMRWKCIAMGRRKDGKACIFEKAIEEDDSTDGSYVSEGNSWVRFKGSPTIWKYLNALDMQERIREFDLDGHTDMTEDDKFTLEPLAKMSARSSEYQQRRRELIKAGLHVVKVRGPNVNERRTPVHHFRPY